jgi:diguanylate cyclase (GGDEF)-like protein
MFEDKLIKLTEFCSKYIIIENDFVERLNKLLIEDDSPIEDFLFIVKKTYPLEDTKIGTLSIENDNDNKTNILNDINLVTLDKVQLYLKFKNNQNFTKVALFENLFNAYWKKLIARKPISLLLPLKEGNMEEIVLSSLENISNQKDCAIVFADIDKFKAINDTYSMQVGDCLISKVSSIIEKHCKDSIPIHRSGDEFIIIHPSDRKDDILLILTKIREDLKDINIEHNKEEVKLDISLSFGIYFIEKGNFESSIKLDDYLEKAEKSVKLADGSKERGKIRIYQEASMEIEDVNTNSVKKSFIKSKINFLNHRPYSNVWLSFISQYVKNIEDLTVSNLQDYFEKTIEIVSPNFTNKIISGLPHYAINYTHSVSIIDIIIAFLNGIVINKHSTIEMKDISIEYDVDNHQVKLLLESSEILKYQQVDKTLLKDFSEINIPLLPNIIGNKTIMDGKISNSLLIIIGSEYNKTLDEIFNTVINVDNRPMTGGGLPDFWEAAIANLINSISTNRNINYIFVMGDDAKKTKISSLLEKINNHTVDDIHTIAYKTGFDSSTVDAIFSKLENKINFISNEDELVNILFDKEFSQDNSFDLSKINYSNIKQKKGYLKQEVNLDNFRLDQNDGCRGESLRKIYPVIINNIREINLQSNTDYSNKQFKELTDYKIILTKPLEDNIPWFYEDDKESFDDYYKNNFLEKAGTFYNKLNEQNQAEIVTNHIVEYLKLSDNKKIINTRRAIIILKNDLIEEKLDPVGLVSIRIYHNFNLDGSININFTYIWRTVEVIVGLPYSMYGSICYSEYLLEKIIEKLKQVEDLKINLKKIKLGNLTYIAQSLHMFRDNYSENIAKNIVDEATI